MRTVSLALSINMTNKNPKKQIKICIGCNKPFNNRKRWESRGQWDEVKYCSDKCRKNK